MADSAAGDNGKLEDVVPAGQSCTIDLKPPKKRADTGRLHSVGHGILSRYPLEALRHLGENLKALRRVEKRFRAELKPHGAIAEIAFDRFWSSYLRCLLAARTEANLVAQGGSERMGEDTTNVRLVLGDAPMLVTNKTAPDSVPVGLRAEILHELSLVQRYDAHFAREMYKALGLLLILRTGGEVALQESLAKIFGLSHG